MPKYRKKPIVIKAFQMTKEMLWDYSLWPEWLHKAWAEGALTIDDCRYFAIVTKEGIMRIQWDDWIIKGIQGELYPCKPDIFEATYELVEE